MRRALAYLLSLILLLIGVRLLVFAIPGDPIETLLAETGTTLPVAELRADLGLDRPFWSSLGHDLVRLVQGDWGTSIVQKIPIRPLLMDRAWQTAQLVGAGVSLGLLIALSLAIWAARSPQGLGSFLARGWSSLVTAIPLPWLGPMLMYVFSVKLLWVPAGGHPVLPVITFGLVFSGFWTQLVLTRLQDQSREASVIAARARGLSELKIWLKYILVPVSGALVAFLGTQIGILLGGAFVTEIVFQWPGLGMFLRDSVFRRDIPAVQMALWWVGFVALTGSLLGDGCRWLMDPRSRAGGLK